MTFPDPVVLSPTNTVPRIGGWLYLVGIGLAFAPLRLMTTLGESHFPAWTKAVGAHKTWLSLELVGTGLLLLASLYLLWLFFKQRRHFPVWYAGIAVLTLVFILIETYINVKLMPNTYLHANQQWLELGRAALTLLIPVPYVLLSKRAKATFVR